MPMPEGALSRLCFAVWFTQVFFGNLPSKGRMEDVTKVAYACSLDKTAAEERSCIILNLACNTTQRIQIMNAHYSLSTHPSAPGIHSHNHSQCVDDTGRQCFGGGAKKCCSDRNPALFHYQQKHKFDLFKMCSWQQTCAQRAIYVNESSDYCAVQYQCAPEKNVSFCNASDATGDSISLIHNTSNTADGNVTCWCIVNSTDPYGIKFQDLRFVDKAGSCIESVNLHIRSLERQINCSLTGNEHLIELQTVGNISGYLEIELTLPAKQNPQMIWIQAEAWNQGSISAQCFSNNQRPPITPIPSTTSSSTISTYDSGLVLNSSTTFVLPNMTSTTSSLTPEVKPESNSTTVVMGTTGDSIPSTKGSTQAFSSTPDGQTVNALSSGEVPMAAIVTPVVLLVMIGTGVVIVAIVFWRKRRKMNDELDGIDGNNYDKAEKKQSEEQLNNYDNCVPPTTPIKTSDNYVILNSESDYNYIDHKDVQKSGSYQEMNNSPAQIQGPDLSNYSASGLHDSNTPDNDGNNTRDAKSGKMEVGNPNYFVLEASGPSVVGQKESLSAFEQRSERTDVEITPNSSDEESHSYSTLEPPNASDEPHKISRFDHVANQKVDTTANNYFVLEPQDTYSSIDPKDAIVQTLPDDEYNVLNIKLQGRENHTGLKYHHVDNKAQECEDYTHIGNSAVGNKDRLQDYSHINLDNAHAANNEASGNEYSHIGSVVPNQSSQSVEGSDYAHLQRKLP